MNDDSLTCGSIFSGIGGLDLGFEEEGFETLWQIEKDPACRTRLKKRFPYAEQFEDVFDVDGRSLRPVSVIHGGFPCQPFATVGKRKGDKDDRFLWPEMRRIIEQNEPEWVVAENVPGILTGKLEAVFETICRSLEELSFEVWPVILPTLSVDGPTIRERVFIIARNRKNSQRRIRNLADAPVESSKRTRGDAPTGRSRPERIVYPSRLRAVVRTGSPGESGIVWPDEPRVGRMAYGVPDRLDRLGAIGNAVCPILARVLAQGIKHAINTD